MLETYCSAPKTLKRLRTGPSAPYIDGFAAGLEETGYSPASAVRYLRAAAHLGHFLDTRGVTFAEIEPGYQRSFIGIYQAAAAPYRTGARSITTPSSV